MAPSTSSVAVVGAGGIGGLLAGMLARTGHDVRVLARGAALDAIRNRGIHVRGVAGDYTQPIARASDDPRALGVADIIVVTVKTWQLAELAPQLVPLAGPTTVVVPLQNGVEASELLAPALGDDRVLGAVARVICWADPPGEIHQLTPVSLTIGARRPGVAEAVESCAQVLRSAGAEVLTTERIDRARWTKFLFIVPYSAVGAVERAPAGGIRTSPRARARLEGAMREIAALAAARGVELAAEIVAQTMARVDEVPADATASMHRDIVAGRPSELDELIGAVVRLGRASGVPTPVSDALYAELEPLERKARAGR